MCFFLVVFGILICVVGFSVHYSIFVVLARGSATPLFALFFCKIGAKESSCPCSQ